MVAGRRRPPLLGNPHPFLSIIIPFLVVISLATAITNIGVAAYRGQRNRGIDRRTVEFVGDVGCQEEEGTSQSGMEGWDEGVVRVGEGSDRGSGTGSRSGGGLGRGERAPSV